MSPDLRDEILRLYNEFSARNGKEPNELNIPDSRWDEFKEIIERSDSYSKPEWYMGMSVLHGTWIFEVGWTEASEKIKQEELLRLARINEN